MTNQTQKDRPWGPFVLKLRTETDKAVTLKDEWDTIERCAQVAENWRKWDDRPPSAEAIAAAIRALKDK